MTSFGFGGYGVQSSDPNLTEKIAKLKSGKPSSKQRIADYLEHDLNVDPRELRLNHSAALERLRELLHADADGDAASLIGSSLGLKRICLSENNAIRTLTDTEHDGVDWHDWNRVWVALVEAHRSDATTFYTFDVQANWENVDVTPVAAKPVKKRIRSYPQGTLLRIQRQLINETGDPVQESLNVSVGGIFDDKGVVILTTMKPMSDLTGWIVIEEL